VVDLLGLEPFLMPDADQAQLIGINIVFDMLLNISLLVGITLTTPLFMAVGSLLTMPVSIFTDWLFHDYVLPISAFLGMLAIVVGFVLLNVAEVIIQKEGASKLPHSDSIAVKLCCGHWQRRPGEESVRA
jgi:drug/metabolite transporter (DMT)-like permease